MILVVLNVLLVCMADDSLGFVWQLAPFLFAHKNSGIAARIGLQRDNGHFISRNSQSIRLKVKKKRAPRDVFTSSINYYRRVE